METSARKPAEGRLSRFHHAGRPVGTNGAQWDVRMSRDVIARTGPAPVWDFNDEPSVIRVPEEEAQAWLREAMRISVQRGQSLGLDHPGLMPSEDLMRRRCVL